MMIEQLYETYLRSRRVTTDSRTITPGCLFFALKGEHFDGNTFASQALGQGAALCVVSDERYRVDDRCILVPDVLATLQELARHHRRHLDIPVVGITGTNGKTTTKELVHAVLARRYRTSATRGNFNNHLGVPLTLLDISADAEIAIVEMGASHPGEIEFLCRIADPDCGLITNVGRAHLEGFGSFEGVVQTKTELYRYLAGKGLRLTRTPTAFVNADNLRLMHEAGHLATIPGLRSFIPAYQPDNPAFVPAAIEKTPLALLTYGSSLEADIRGTLVDCNPYLHFYFEVDDSVYNVHTHLLGNYNFDNCMAAVAVGLRFGVEPFDIKEAIEAYTPSNQRSEYRETARGNRLYLDCYNANPSSMEAAVKAFASLPPAPIRKEGASCEPDTDRRGNPSPSERGKSERLAIIGGMHELGRDERHEHQRLVDLLASSRLDRVLLVGPEFNAISLPSNMLLVPDTDAVARWLKANPILGATILVKGSNTNRLWTLEKLL